MKRTLTSNIFLLLFLIALPLVAAQKMAVVTKAAGDLLKVRRVWWPRCVITGMAPVRPLSVKWLADIPAVS